MSEVDRGINTGEIFFESLNRILPLGRTSLELLVEFCDKLEQDRLTLDLDLRTINHGISNRDVPGGAA